MNCFVFGGNCCNFAAKKKMIAACAFGLYSFVCQMFENWQRLAVRDFFSKAESNIFIHPFSKVLLEVS